MLSVFCKILLKLDLFFTAFLSGCNPHQQSNSSLFAWKSSHTKLLARDVVENGSHLPDVTSSGSSVPPPVKTKPLYYGPFGKFLMLLWATRLSFHSHHLQGWLRCVAAHQPLGTCCHLMVLDTAQQHSGMLSIFQSAATHFCSAHTHRRKVLLSTFKHFIFSPDPHQPLPLSSITSTFFLK